MDIFSHQTEISTAEFLKNYWQQKPLLIRQALPQYQSPITADELAGLSLEEDLESRLIIQRDEDATNGSSWQLQHGPFDEKIFSTLPEKFWTLLVQGVDTVRPKIAELLDYFNFIPNWRLDDIMISYATDQGSVGPHFDHYDVFLLQADGDRLWQLGDFCNNEELVKDCDLSLLKAFNKREEFLLSPGDMLYLPPKMAHWGIAQGNCMTFSIGFRAPKTSEILSAFCDERLQQLTKDDFYRDVFTEKYLESFLQNTKSEAKSNTKSINNVNLDTKKNSGEISAEVIASIKSMLLKELSNDDYIAQWFGQHMTTPRYPHLFGNESDLNDHDSITDNSQTESSSNIENLSWWRDELSNQCSELGQQENEALIKKQDGSRFAYCLFSDNKNKSFCFINGQQFETSTDLAELLCNNTSISLSDLKHYRDNCDQTLLNFLVSNELIEII